MAGEVRVRTRGLDIHVTQGLEAWNACRELRDSRTKAEACRAATQLYSGPDFAIRRSDVATTHRDKPGKNFPAWKHLHGVGNCDTSQTALKGRQLG
jgi:hypothetical protein